MAKGNSFNDEIDSYIEKRRSTNREKKRSFLKRVSSWWKSKRERSTSDPIDVKEEELEEIEHDIEEIDREEEELEEVREGLMTRFLKLLRKKERYEEEEEEMIEVEAEESEEKEGYDKEVVKELIKLQHKWMDNLPADELSRFKRSDDFDRYVELLEELELVEK